MDRINLKHLAVVATATLFLFHTAPALAHKGEEHGHGGVAAAAPVDQPVAVPASQPVAAPASQPVAVPADTAALNVINNRYLRDVRPIFKRACFNCHSEHVRYPSYYVIPGVRQLIDWDIREAREHMDMGADFPFKGHGTPLKDLKAILEEVEEGGMPPIYYKVLHWKERLTDDEELIIQRWASEGIKLLPAAPPEPAAGK